MMADCAWRHLEPVRNLLGCRRSALNDAQDAMAHRVGQRLHLLRRIDIERERKLWHGHRHILWKRLRLAPLSRLVIVHTFAPSLIPTARSTYGFTRTCGKHSTAMPQCQVAVRGMFSGAVFGEQVQKA